MNDKTPEKRACPPDETPEIARLLEENGFRVQKVDSEIYFPAARMRFYTVRFTKELPEELRPEAPAGPYKPGGAFKLPGVEEPL